MLIAKGTLPCVEVTDFELKDNLIKLNYLTKIGLPKVSTIDKITLIVIFKNGAIYVARQIRGEGISVSIELTNRNINKIEILFGYVFALSTDGKKASNSEYIEILEARL